MVDRMCTLCLRGQQQAGCRASWQQTQSGCCQHGSPTRVILWLQGTQESQEIVAVVSLCSGTWTAVPEEADVAVGSASPSMSSAVQNEKLPLVTPNVLLVRVACNNAVVHKWSFLLVDQQPQHWRGRGVSGLWALLTTCLWSLLLPGPWLHGIVVWYLMLGMSTIKL